jgi:acyl carrier protein
MGTTRDAIIARISATLPFGADPSELEEDRLLSDLGVTSLHLITLLMTLQQDYSLDVDQMIQAGMPTTVRELVTLIEQGARAGTTQAQLS